jgi:hypothetical protein
VAAESVLYEMMAVSRVQGDLLKGRISPLTWVCVRGKIFVIWGSTVI